MITKITENDMSQVKAADIALVDFSATWCGPCKMLAPEVEALAEEMPEVTFFNADVDENQGLCMDYRIVSVPSLLVFKNGEAVARTVGYQDKASLKEFLTSQM
jgi:thioredoxin 1